jgi:hypothetical protein
MGATCSSETSVDFQRTTRRDIPEDKDSSEINIFWTELNVQKVNHCMRVQIFTAMEICQRNVYCKVGRWVLSWAHLTGLIFVTGQLFKTDIVFNVDGYTKLNYNIVKYFSNNWITGCLEICKQLMYCYVVLLFFLQPHNYDDHLISRWFIVLKSILMIPCNFVYVWGYPWQIMSG